MPIPAILARMAAGYLSSGGRRGGAGVSLADGVDVHLEFEGWESFLRKLDSVARSQAPAACANALNRSGTKVVQRTKKFVGKAEGKKRNQLGGKDWGIRVAKRARAPYPLRTQVVSPGDRKAGKIPPVPVSKSFNIAGRGARSRYVRALARPGRYRGKGRTEGRPQTSPTNLPIYRVGVSHRTQRRRLTLERAGRVVMREFYPKELVRQLNTRIAKLKARRY